VRSDYWQKFGITQPKTAHASESGASGNHADRFGIHQQWLSKWEVQVGTDKTSAFEQFLQDKRCPERVRELAQEPLLLYLLAACIGMAS
jgi:hypothetical protein